MELEVSFAECNPDKSIHCTLLDDYKYGFVITVYATGK